MNRWQIRLTHKHIWQAGAQVRPFWLLRLNRYCFNPVDHYQATFGRANHPRMPDLAPIAALRVLSQRPKGDIKECFPGIR